MSRPRDVDVVVIGGGPAGCAAATRLAEAGHGVLVLEREPVSGNRDRTSGEVLAPATQLELAEVGVEVKGEWVLDPFVAVRNVFPGGRYVTFSFPDGFRYVHVDRAGLHDAMRARAAQAGAAVQHDAVVQDVRVDAAGAVVQTCDGEHRAPLVIDAAGRNSPTLRRLRM
jgi:flavin-dependent dehydrogenase